MSGRRAHFVDLLRLLASFQMVQGHTVDALLAEELRQGLVYSVWSWIRGLTAVSFLFAAGLSYHLSTLGRFERHKADTGSVRRRLLRAGQLVLVGYAIHLPLDLLWADRPGAYEAAVIVDVLQCIGLTLAFLELLTLLCRRPAQVIGLSALGSLFCLGLAPWASALPVEGPLRPLLNYLSRDGGSLFPLLPWSGYFLAGVPIAAFALPEGSATEPTRVALRLAGLGAPILGLGLLARALGGLRGPGTEAADPAFSLTKLGAVVLLTAALALASARLRSMPRAARALAGETLMLYVSHLLVLYGGGVGLGAWIGHRLSLPTTLFVVLIMMVGTAALGLAWRALKDRVTARE